MHTRLLREVQLLERDPPHGVTVWPANDSLMLFNAIIQGPSESPYEGGSFKLEVALPSSYPFEPPKIKFLTPIYHPNIDDAGRICLDTLKMPPKGGWKPSLNLSTVLAMIGILMSNPNPDDGLMPAITAEFQSNRGLFIKNATEWTAKHAKQVLVPGATGAGERAVSLSSGSPSGGLVNPPTTVVPSTRGDGDGHGDDDNDDGSNNNGNSEGKKKETDDSSQVGGLARPPSPSTVGVAEREPSTLPLTAPTISSTSTSSTTTSAAPVDSSGLGSPAAEGAHAPSKISMRGAAVKPAKKNPYAQSSSDSSEEDEGTEAIEQPAIIASPRKRPASPLPSFQGGTSGGTPPPSPKRPRLS